MAEMVSSVFRLILLFFVIQNAYGFPTMGNGANSPTAFYCFVMPDMTWQCKCPEAARVYVMYQYPTFALVCNGYNQLEFLTRAGPNRGDAIPLSPINTYGFQHKHAVQIAHPLNSWADSDGYDKTDSTPTSSSSSSTPNTTPPTPLAEPYASGVAETSDNSASSSGYHRHYVASSLESNIEKSSTPLWSSSTTSTTEKPKPKIQPIPKKTPITKVPNYPVTKPELKEEPRSDSNSEPDENEDKGCTYLGRHLKKGQSFKPPWGCALYCNGNNSLFRKC
ncbi:uncharacterized protein LOC117335807 [Pecten maximus]|uniref:uncharacterized protein LOC117335807 n=1 Tax=Pecten maximus TaxID=6579 RepID=UPI00145825FE|nr:uncharacterized protein LOC117335807 [Pecten maximus]